MSSTRSILRFLSLKSRKSKKHFSRNLVTALLIHLREFGTASFFLNGNVVVKNAKGEIKHIYSAINGLSEPKKSKKMSIAETVNKTLSGYPNFESLENSHPFHQTLFFKRSVMKLREKANEI